MFHELIVLRPAKSSWPVGGRDTKRPLSARGVRDARAYGLVLEAAGTRIDAVVVSPVERTRETWRRVSGPRLSLRLNLSLAGFVLFK